MNVNGKEVVILSKERVESLVKRVHSYELLSRKLAKDLRNRETLLRSALLELGRARETSNQGRFEREWLEEHDRRRW